jgi:Spy/CpxP family protein refolding chaperone
MRWKQRAGSAAVGLFVAVAAGGGTPGCAESGVPPTTTANSAQVEAVSPAGPEVGADEPGAKLVEHYQHHHGGVAMFLAMSLDSLGLPDAEKAAVTKVQTDLRAKLDPSRDAQHDVLAVLADGIAAGSVDVAKVDAAITQVDASSSAAEGATTDALNQLYTVLTPPERAALVQKLEAHWQVWQQANADEDAQGGDKKRGDRLAVLTRDLSLTSDQVDKIRASSRSGPPDGQKKLDASDVDGRLRAFGNAFTSETFDAKALNGGDGIKVELTSRGVRRMARFYEVVAPVLTPDQRAKLAAHLREHAGQESGK